MYKPSLWLRPVGFLVVVVAAMALLLMLPALLHFDLAALITGRPAMNRVNGGLLGTLLLSLVFDRFGVSADIASRFLAPFVGLAIDGIAQLM